MHLYYRLVTGLRFPEFFGGITHDSKISIKYLLSVSYSYTHRHFGQQVLQCLLSMLTLVFLTLVLCKTVSFYFPQTCFINYCIDFCVEKHYSLSSLQVRMQYRGIKQGFTTVISRLLKELGSKVCDQFHKRGSL